MPDDRFRYEAMPTRGMAETFRAIKLLRQRLSQMAEKVDIPWMVIQSMDDAVVSPNDNVQFFLKNAFHPGSKGLLYHADKLDSPLIDDS